MFNFDECYYNFEFWIILQYLRKHNKYRSLRIINTLRI